MATATASMTATFTPPPDCLSDVYLYGGDQLLGAQTPSCFPPDWSSLTTVFYSPGVCPSGYWTACSSVVTAETIIETHATCCLSVAHGQFQCQSSGQATTPLMCTGVMGGDINAYGVQIRWQSIDRNPVTHTVVPTFTSTSMPPASPTSPTSKPADLSIGAEAGIGVGVALAVLLIIVLGVWMLLQRKRRHTFVDTVAAQPALGGYYSAQRKEQKLDHRNHTDNHHADSRHEVLELCSALPLRELSGESKSRGVYELGASDTLTIDRGSDGIERALN
ncbi:hypothetical protein LTS00_016901 [Friedmanniomyces endolithicus]|nr:hypothetical protein LTS00_016901 [Friedmanniomyces endolithicus]